MKKILFTVLSILLFAHFGYGQLSVPTDVVVDSLSESSFKIMWVDNSIGETGYGIYIVSPGGVWYTKSLAANTEIDTLINFFPPAGRLILKVGVFDASDTIYSALDTCWAMIRVPDQPIAIQKGVTSFRISIDGYNFFDNFSDGDYLTGPDWSVGDGSFSVVDKEFYLKSGSSAFNSIFSAYSDYSNLARDGEFGCYFRFSDTDYISNQDFYFYLATGYSDTSSAYYFVKIDSQYIRFYKSTDGTVGNRQQLTSYAWKYDYNWHYLKVQNDWTYLVTDSLANWVIYLDNSSVATVVDSTPVLSKGDYLGVGMMGAGIGVDNVFIRGLTPGSNSSDVVYAIQEINSGYYVTTSGGVSASAQWGNFSEFGSFYGLLVTGLSPQSTYQFRLYAKRE